MTPKTQPLTLDSLREDVAHVRQFLMALDKLAPEYVGSELVEYLESVEKNPIALQMLGRALAK